MLYDSPRGTVTATSRRVTTKRIPSVIFFSLPNAIGDRNIVGSLTNVSCVFAPVSTSGIILRDDLSFTVTVRGLLMGGRTYQLTKLCLF